MRPTADRHRRSLLVAVAWLTLTAACSDSGGPGAEPRLSFPPAPTETPSDSPAPKKPRGPAPFDPQKVSLRLEEVATGFEAPLLVTNAGDGSNRIFVVEQGGTVRVVEGSAASADPFLDISELTEASGEQGLLGLAFHPDYETNGRLFVNYTDNEGDTIVAEYAVDPNDPNHVDASSAETLLRIDQPFPNHNGGHLVFGPDGFLHIGTGDGGSAGDPNDNGQRLDTHLGKLLRIDVDSRTGGLPYGIPTDNPFKDLQEARPEIWAYGLRNPWRFSFDRHTQTLWVADVGQSSIEEVNRVPAAAAGLNYGWDDMEGSACYEPPSGCQTDERIVPLTEYTHSEGGSITGGFVYRGPERSLVGGFFFGDFLSGTIWAVRADGPARQAPTKVLDTELSISSFGLDESGELYVTDLTGGSIYRLESQ